MIKATRHQTILRALEDRGTLTVAEMMEMTGASKMTLWRDLEELAKSGALEKIHGGASSLRLAKLREKSNSEKKLFAHEQKAEVAEQASRLIQDNETIFLGPGTTIEHLANLLMNRKLRVVTNSIEIFNLLAPSQSLDLFLVGGEYREITGAFIGRAANRVVSSLQFAKAFIGANAVFGNHCSTYNENEGDFNEIALSRSVEKYLLVTSEKFNIVDFYSFYDLNDLTAIITDSKIQPETLEKYGQYTRILHPEGNGPSRKEDA